MDQPASTIPTKDFYDLIAKEYNTHLVSEENNRIRKQVSKIFTEKISEGPVLDFGGGTGLDLPWMLSQPYQIFFLEPSDQMRKVAIESVDKINANVFFLRENLNFLDWSCSNLPFDEKVEGVLANFAVCNCIENISTLFENLSIICKPGAYVIATVLDVRWHRVLKNYPLGIFLSTVLKKNEPVIYNNYNGFGHKTYLHSISHLKNSAKNFYWVDYLPIEKSPFVVIILQKK